MKTLKQFFSRLPPDGRARDAFSRFNGAPKAQGVQSAKALAETLGFSVERVHLPLGFAGRLVHDPFARNGCRIEVNAKDSVVRQRWTVLHEIAHYFLHFDRLDPFAPEKCRDRSDPFYSQEELKEEHEADAFVAALYFDRGALAAARASLGDSLPKLARHFGVSEGAVRIALAQGWWE